MHLAATILALILGAALSLPAQAQEIDPLGRGGYSVGVTTRFVTRMLPNGDYRTLEIMVWYPARADEAGVVEVLLQGVVDAPPADWGQYPLIVFSHGNTGQPWNMSFFLSHLVSQGFVVAGPFHNDCNCGDGAYENLQRADDVRSVLDEMLRLSHADDPILANMTDPTRVGIAGYSRGGWTALRAMEFDERYSAGLLVAPATYLPPAANFNVSKPLLVFQGELDAMVPFVRTQDFFSSIPETAPDRWFIDIPRGGHWFGPPFPRNYPEFSTAPQSEILPFAGMRTILYGWGTAFVQTYVAGDQRYDEFLDSSSSDAFRVTRVETGSRAPLPLPPIARTVAPDEDPAPAPAPGAVLFRDALDVSLTGKLPASRPDENRTTGYVNGHYVIMSLTVEGQRAESRHSVLVPGAYADVSIGVDARIPAPTPDQAIEVACRVQGNGDAYRFSVLPELRLFQLARIWQGQLQSLTPPLSPVAFQESSAIEGANRTNHLDLLCQGTVITAAINGTQVATVRDNTFPSGNLSLGTAQVGRQSAMVLGIAEVPSGRPIAVQLDHFEVRQP